MSEEHGKLVSLGELSEEWKLYQAIGGTKDFHEWLQAQGFTLANANQAYLPARPAPTPELNEYAVERDYKMPEGLTMDGRHYERESQTLTPADVGSADALFGERVTEPVVERAYELPEPKDLPTTAPAPKRRK